MLSSGAISPRILPWSVGAIAMPAVVVERPAPSATTLLYASVFRDDSMVIPLEPHDVPHRAPACARSVDASVNPSAAASEPNKMREKEKPPVGSTKEPPPNLILYCMLPDTPALVRSIDRVGAILPNSSANWRKSNFVVKSTEK